MLGFLCYSLLFSIVEPLQSGPQPGQRPGPYSFLMATGKNRGQPHCLICETDTKPAVIVFCRKLDPAIEDTVKSLEKWLDNKEAVAAKATGWLTVLGEKSSTEDELSKWAQKLGLKNIPVGIYDDSKGPPGYRLSTDAHVTILLFKDKKVVVNHTFREEEWNAQAALKVQKDWPTLLK